MGLIYKTNVLQKIGCTVVSTQNLAFINMNVSGGYDQIFLSYRELPCSIVNLVEICNKSISLI